MSHTNPKRKRGSALAKSSRAKQGRTFLHDAERRATISDAGGRPRSFTVARVSLIVFLIACMLTGGCTSLPEYLQNGLKVGPNYGRPPAPVAPDWIDAADKRVRSDPHDLSAWYTVFKDPVLDSLICSAYQQNLTLREAGSRVLQARAQLAIAAGSFFPQTQDMTGDYTRNAVSTRVANRSNVSSQFFNQWDYGFHLAWELDFWGRFRRAIEAASASLDASVEDY